MENGKQVFQCFIHAVPFGKLTTYLCDHDLMTLQDFYQIEIVRRADEKRCEVCVNNELKKGKVAEKLKEAPL